MYIKYMKRSLDESMGQMGNIDAIACKEDFLHYIRLESDNGRMPRQCE